MLEPEPPAEDQVGAEQRPGLGEPGRRGAGVTRFQAVLGQVPSAATVTSAVP